jgi:hypothetical protein
MSLERATQQAALGAPAVVVSTPAAADDIITG